MISLCGANAVVCCLLACFDVVRSRAAGADSEATAGCPLVIVACSVVFGSHRREAPKAVAEQSRMSFRFV